MKLIVAVDKNWAIGKDNDLLFSLKKDMAFFRQTTSGQVVVMGRRTLESLPCGPLKNRKNIVLSRGLEYNGEGDLTVASNLDVLFKLLQGEKREVFVMGGASVYRTLLPYCTHALITKVDALAQADTHLDNLDTSPDWVIENQSEPQHDEGYTITFLTYKNLNPKEY